MSVETAAERRGGRPRRPGDCDEWLAFTPRDTVIVRDGRSFDAGTDAAAETVRPWPSTVAGAVRAAYGEEPAEVRGPVLARQEGTGRWRAHFPMPADVVRRSGPRGPGRAYLLRPDPALAEVTTDLGSTVAHLLSPPAAVTVPVEPADGWVPADRLAAYLRGEFAATGFAFDDLGAAREDPLPVERRVGLARTRGRTARDGYFFQAGHLRPRDGWAFLAGCVHGEGGRVAPGGPVPLGGRGRLADVTPASGVGWPDAPESYPGGRVLVYVATPAIWPGGWRLPVPPGAELTAAVVPAPQAVATASPYRAVRDGKGLMDTVTMRWAVPAGAVYLLTFTGADEAAAWAAEHHGCALGPALGATTEEDRVRTAGFGVVLTGTWTGTSTGTWTGTWTGTRKEPGS